MNNKKVLLVEDESSLRQLMKTYFLKEGAEVIEAGDGRAALNKFEENNIDLVILDIMLPEYDGWSVCKRIREKSDIPILMLTARSEENDKLFGFELGADDYMTKPFSLKELIARSKVLIKRSRKEMDLKDILILENIKIDRLSHKVFINNIEVEFSPKEYDLLNYFVTNKNQALSREMILNGVWGYDYYGDLRTVDTHIKRLRQKLEDEGDKITTVRGFGYRFEVTEWKETQFFLDFSYIL